MRISIIAMLVSISAMCFGQTDTSYHWLPVEDEIIRLYDEYAAELPTNKRHIDPAPSWYEHLDDCELEEVMEQRGFDSWVEIICRNEEHFVQVPIKPSFEGFIKWLKTK